jgi:hypothetical protein
MAICFDLGYLLNNFNRLYRTIIDCLKFYANPKAFLEEVVSQKIEILVKKLIISFIFIESLLILIGSVLINKFDYGLGKVPGLILVDCIYSMPLILIIFISLKLAKITLPLKKAISLVLFTKIFIGLPIQLIYFLFVSTENYIFYASFWIAVLLILLIYLILPTVVYCERLKQTAIVLSLTFALFFLLVIITGALSQLGSISTNDDSQIGKYDPIYSEYNKLGQRTKTLDAIDFESFRKKARQFLNEDMNGDPIKNLEEFKEDAKYHIGNYKEKVRTELEFFSNKDNYEFKTNQKRYEIYVRLLYEVMNFIESYYKTAYYYSVRIENIRLEQDIKVLEEEVRKYSDLGDDENQRKLILNEIRKKGLGVRLTMLERINQLQELHVSLLKKQSIIMENKVNVLRFLTSFEESYSKIQEIRLEFMDSEIKYLDIVLRWSFII